MSLHIALDLDDVLLDFCGGLANAIRKEYDVDLSIEDFYQFDLHPILDPILGRSWWDWLRDRDWLWSTFPAVDGAIGAVERLRRDGHYLEVVTAKPRWAEHEVWKWLGKWRPAVHQVTVVEVGARKSSWTDADVLIDDKLENCLEFAASTPQRDALLFSRPHNSEPFNASGAGSVLRVDGWAHTLDMIGLLA